LPPDSAQDVCPIMKPIIDFSMRNLAIHCPTTMRIRRASLNALP